MVPIYEHFHALNPEKQQKIRDAAYREFSYHGYKKTSVEQIAKSAGIAKGMIFHYFGSKLGLFEFLIAWADDFIKEHFGGLSERMKQYDFIEQYRFLVQVKLEAYTANPYVFEFYTMIFMHPENLEVSQNTKISYESIMLMRTEALADLSSSEVTSLFRDDMEAERIKSYIGWFIDGYTQRLLGELTGRPLADMDLQPYWDEFDIIVDDLKKLFYQSE